ncbi:MAG TPA: xanthine dehydrogenase family protein molybdopterin-binding subunit [Gemmatimonadales bacterium]|jgi:xanthine dehydrogenase YagR molybdenum-binding subunit|nr:xanthine dehydrogenase family protein molybdopterin-binding subunit [Gemmatimonadales bacterium]
MKRFVTTTVEVEGREETAVVEVPAFEPVPWGPEAALDTVGTRVRRLDALEKVTGRARYTHDVRLPGMLHARFVRAPIPAGRVSRLDLAHARALPGVRGVLTGADLPRIPWLEGEPLFASEIHYWGQPLAAVAADTEAIARDAVRLARVRCRPAPFRVDLPSGKDSVRTRHSRVTPPETRREERGNVAAALRDAAVAVTATYRVPVAIHQALETHGSVVHWDGDRVTVYDSTQAIFRVRNELAEHLGVGQQQVRVVTEYMGGGFGAKNSCGAYTVVAALLSKRTGRPVRCVWDRHEECVDAGHRPETVFRVTAAARRDGTLVALDVEAWIAMGVVGWPGGPGKIFQELYRCPNVRVVQHFWYGNVGGMEAFRGPFHTEGAFALESALDLLAKQLGIDPLELRRRNHAAEDPLKQRPFSSELLPACWDSIAQRIGWAAARKRKKATGRFVRGVGIASQTWGAAGGPPAYAVVRLNRDGTALVQTGTQDLGTGARTILAQIAAEALGLPLRDVRIVVGDTDAGPYAPNSWGSMTTASVGPAVRMAAEDAKRQLFEVAAEMLRAQPDQLKARRGRISVCGGAPSVPISKVTKTLGNIMIIGRGHRGPNPAGVTVHSFGAQAAEVEVDRATGQVRVLRIVAAHDCGRVVNPELAESQLHGGIILGLGYALFERLLTDPHLGRPLNLGLHEYKIPTYADIPEIDAKIISVADPVANHVGAKGLAEPPIIPTAPAIANAVFDAIGVQITELPLTPARVLAALSERR